MLTHAQKVRKIIRDLQNYNLTSNKKLRFYHGGTNSTRNQNEKDYFWIDISMLSQVIQVSAKEKYALVEPNVSMDKLVNETLKYNLIPRVVMEFPGITTGGGVNGAALESSSFKYGQFCDTCKEYEIVLGNGKIIKASPNKNRDIFYGISGSYGSLGLIASVKIKLIPASPYVRLKFHPIKGYQKSLEFLKNEVYRKDVNYLEGILFGSKDGVIITGKFSEKIQLPITTYSKAKDLWFYERAEKVSEGRKIYEELVPIRDYLFRYNRGAFWTAENIFPMFKIPRNKITKFLLNPFINTRKLYDGLHALNISQEFFLQDFYVPFSKAVNFLKFSEKQLRIFPIWLCPVKPTKTLQKLSPNYIDTDILIDIGIWGRNKKYLSNPIGFNLNFEEFAKRNNSRKMLYAHAYYSQDEFWKIYDKIWYKNLRRKYSSGPFSDIWKKTHVSEKYQSKKFRGMMKIIFDSLKGQNLNA